MNATQTAIRPDDTSLTRAVADLPVDRALQQPSWPDAEHLRRVTGQLHRLPPLAAPEDVRRLATLLRSVAGGAASVIQAGDCAEDPADCHAEHVVGQLGMLTALAGQLQAGTRRPVIRVGRIAGQYAKPRSKPTEVVDGVELPAFRGLLVNGPGPNERERRPDPNRMLVCYWAASRVTEFLRSRRGTHAAHGVPVWTSHEALVLDYELPQLREDDGALVLTSTHWPWIGERTRNLDGPHVALMARIANPVAVKIGPSITCAETLALADRLDPDRVPGRLTLISRMGADVVRTALPPLVEALRAEGHEVIWMCDPMHANTVTASGGLKTRYLHAVVDEVRAFREVLRAANAHAGGLHLEATAEGVLECLSDATQGHADLGCYRSLCDPRLNLGQAFEVVSAW